MHSSNQAKPVILIVITLLLTSGCHASNPDTPETTPFPQAAGGASQAETIIVDQPQEQASFIPPFSPTSLSVDPHQLLLADVSVSSVASLESTQP